MLFYSQALPFGGVKGSGYGRFGIFLPLSFFAIADLYEYKVDPKDFVH